MVIQELFLLLAPIHYLINGVIRSLKSGKLFTCKWALRSLIRYGARVCITRFIIKPTSVILDSKD